MRWWRDFWHGRIPLGTSFWLFYEGVWFAALFVLVLVSAGLGKIGLGKPALALTFAALNLYPLLAAVGVWRSANAYPYKRLWANIAKGWVAVEGVLIVIHLATGGARAIFDLALS
jgi:hypothetical protein